MNKAANISALILAEMTRNGGNIKAAFDAVIAPGAYEKLAGEVYDALRAAK